MTTVEGLGDKLLAGTAGRTDDQKTHGCVRPLWPIRLGLRSERDSSMFEVPTQQIAEHETDGGANLHTPRNVVSDDPEDSAHCHTDPYPNADVYVALLSHFSASAT